MRRRLMLAMVGLVAVVLVIAGAGSLVLTRNAARSQAQQQLVSEANSLTSAGSGTRSLEVLRVVRATLKLENAEIIRIDRLGTIVTPLPDGLSAQDIDVGAVQSGRDDVGPDRQPGLRRGAGQRDADRAGAPAARRHARHPPDP